VRGVRTDRYTFTVGAAGSGPVILFDRQNDPYQLENVAPAHPEVCRQLLDELNRWLVNTNDPWKRLPWPIIPKGAFPVRRHAGGFTVDFEEDPAADLWAATSSAFAALTEKTDEVLGGKRSLKCDTTASGERFHEFLRLHDLLLPNKEYEVTYRYRVLAASEETRFYTVVRSSVDIQQRAVRLYWNEPPGPPQTRTFRFHTGGIRDHHLLFGVEFRGAIVIDDVTVQEAQP
jgi:hypothetical protein